MDVKITDGTAIIGIGSSNGKMASFYETMCGQWQNCGRSPWYNLTKVLMLSALQQV